MRESARSSHKRHHSLMSKLSNTSGKLAKSRLKTVITQWSTKWTQSANFSIEVQMQQIRASLPGSTILVPVSIIRYSHQVSTRLSLSMRRCELRTKSAPSTKLERRSSRRILSERKKKTKNCKMLSGKKSAASRHLKRLRQSVMSKSLKRRCLRPKRPKAWRR